MAPFHDPIVPLLVFVSSNPNNYSKWKNAHYDRLIDEIAGMGPGAERTAKIVEAQKILLNEECILVPLYHYVQLQAVRPELKGFQVNPFGIIQWREMSR
jgi:oligopeptide transport system substrate-binding protein